MFRFDWSAPGDRTIKSVSLWRGPSVIKAIGRHHVSIRTFAPGDVIFDIFGGGLSRGLFVDSIGILAGTVSGVGHFSANVAWTWYTTSLGKSLKSAARRSNLTRIF